MQIYFVREILDTRNPLSHYLYHYHTNFQCQAALFEHMKMYNVRSESL